MQFVKILSYDFDKIGRRILKFLRFGKRDVQTSFESVPYGFDSSPIKDTIAIYAETSEKGKTVCIGYLNKNLLSGPGELRIFSTDENGELKTFIWLKNNGIIELGGDSRNLTRFQELESGFNELRSNFNDFVNNYNTHVHTGVTTGPGSSGMTASMANPSSASIAGAKIDEIKTL